MRDIPHDAPLYFPRLSYCEAMTSWGSDKPDTRLGSKLHQVQDFLDPTLKSKISSLKDPIVDLIRVKVTSNPQKAKRFIGSFLDSPSAAIYLDNPHGAPGIFIFEPSKPMNGLSAFEHEAAEKIINLVHPQRGDLLVLQARPNQPFAGQSSTMIGNLRRDLHAALVSQGHISMPRQNQYMWITDFPLFSLTDDTDPGQGGEAGMKSTHHPFTAPKTLSDVEKMLTDPLSCTADHFDLVINGVEVGGGSRRIHDSQVQEMVLKDILKVPKKQTEEFRPLLEALRAGCPPHAGIALGFDRLMAILRQKNTVRDVIAFPKSANGEDKMVGAPSKVDQQRWTEYHMVPQGGEKA
jgi:aspartyl-tRNA synthetase